MRLWGRAPLGYLNDHAGGPIKIDPGRAPLVVKAFEIMAGGQCSLSMLVNRMAQPGLRTCGGYKVQKSSMERMLKNPFYIGIIVWTGQRYPGTHEPLVSKSLFDTANAVMSGRNVSAKPRTNGFLFNNLAECGLCWCKVIGEKKKGRYIYYHCTYSKGRHSGIPYIPENQFIDLFEDSVRKVTISDDSLTWLKDVLEDSQGELVRLTESRVVELNEKKGMLEDRLNRLYDNLCDGRLTPDVFGRKESEYRSELSDVIGALNDCEQDRYLELSEGSTRRISQPGCEPGLIGPDHWVRSLPFSRRRPVCRFLPFGSLAKTPHGALSGVIVDAFLFANTVFDGTEILAAHLC